MEAKVSKEVMGRDGCTCFDKNDKYSLMQVAHFEGHSISIAKLVSKKVSHLYSYLVCGPNEGCHGDECPTAVPYEDEEDARKLYAYREERLLSMEVSDVLS